MNFKNTNIVVTRFPPSPTGKFHIGSYRTAIFNYLYAKKMGGKFILRIEDTDKERSKNEYIDDILENLFWFDIIPDEIKIDNINYTEDKKTKIKYILQSGRLERHKFILEKMIAMNLAYVSKEKAKNGSGEIKELIRFKNPNKIVFWNDIVRGEIKIDTTDLGDFIVARDINNPLYHLAAVIDDFESEVTHIIRGEDHIPNTPRQILIKEAVEKITGIKKDFIYAHLPLVLGQDKLKLSKRRGAKSISEYRELGYLKEAIFNCSCLIGWNPGSRSEQEIFSKQELENIFNLEKIHKAAAILNEEKLNWFNKEYIKKQNNKEQMISIKKYLPNAEKFREDMLQKIQETIINRISYYGELQILDKLGEFDFYLNNPIFNEKNPAEKLIWKKSFKEKTILNLKELKIILENTEINTITEENLENIWKKIEALAEKEGKGDVLWPLRYALSGKDKSPDPKLLLNILGVKISLQRINNAINNLIS